MENLNLVELNENELNAVTGGWLQFLAGAIAGGMVYDAYKYACESVLDAYADGVYSGMPARGYMR